MGIPTSCHPPRKFGGRATVLPTPLYARTAQRGEKSTSWISLGVYTVFLWRLPATGGLHTHRHANWQLQGEGEEDRRHEGRKCLNAEQNHTHTHTHTHTEMRATVWWSPAVVKLQSFRHGIVVLRGMMQCISPSVTSTPNDRGTTSNSSKSPTSCTPGQ